MRLLKLITDERVKHRLTGVIVILSIAIIFVPAMIKKSNQHLGENMNIAVKLPPKPVLPQVAMVDKKVVFETVKVARVTAPTPVAMLPVTAQNDVQSNTMPVVKTDAQAGMMTHPVAKPVVKSVVQSFSKSVSKPASSVIPVANYPTQVIQPAVAHADKAKPQSGLPAPIMTHHTNTHVSETGAYALQVASLSQQRNADFLVSRLKQKGYTHAMYMKVPSSHGLVYKVIIGQLNRRDDAVQLQKKLSESMHLNGFIVKTNVS